jgi:glucan phosphoethanolaminetransferase (alkaline phosphatase superfamily)
VGGTYLTEVYVFMHVTLTLIPLLTIREIGVRMRVGIATNALVANLFGASMVFVTLTGIFPSKTATNVKEASTPKEYNLHQQYNLIHTYGIMVGVIVPCVILFVFAVMRLKPKGEFKAIAIRAVFIVSIVAVMLFFNTIFMHPDTLDFCSEFQDEASCNAFPPSPDVISNVSSQPQQFKYSDVRYTCGWVENEYSLSEDSKTGTCKRKTCQLNKNALSIAAEYAALFVPLVYISSFALHDLQYLETEASGSGGEDRAPILG